MPPTVGAATTILVAQHGTGRAMFDMRNAFGEFGRYNDCLVLAPLFPVGPLGDGNSDGFKYIREGDIRYDLVLLGMIDEVAGRYGVNADKVFLYGYSGGGHFAHRFFYLHPDRLRAVSIGAPGSVTLPDETHDYWVGCRNLEALFGTRLDVAAMRQVPVHQVVGGADRETWEITHRQGGRNWMEGANSAGETRVDRSTTLNEAFSGARHQDPLRHHPRRIARQPEGRRRGEGLLSRRSAGAVLGPGSARTPHLNPPPRPQRGKTWRGGRAFEALPLEGRGLGGGDRTIEGQPGPRSAQIFFSTLQDAFGNRSRHCAMAARAASATAGRRDPKVPSSFLLSHARATAAHSLQKVITGRQLGAPFMHSSQPRRSADVLSGAFQLQPIDGFVPSATTIEPQISGTASR